MKEFFVLIDDNGKGLVQRSFQMWRGLQSFKPHIVWGHYLTNYGYLASLLPVGTLRVISTWGSDILPEAKLADQIKRFVAINFSDIIIPSFYTLELEARIKSYLLGSVGKIEKSYFGVDLKAFGRLSELQTMSFRQTLGIPDTAIVITLIRHAKAIYNTKVFFDTARRLLGEFEELVFMMIPGFAEQELLDEAQILAKDSKRFILHLGFQTPDQLNYIYNISNFGLSLLRKDMLGAPILELMASGGVPILTKLPSYTETFGDEDSEIIYLEDVSVKGLSELLRSLLSSGEVNAKRSKINCEFAGRYNLSSGARKIMEIFKNKVRNTGGFEK